jgi:hypothetical protein
VLTHGVPVLSGDVPRAVSVKYEQVWRELQDDLATLSTDSVHAIAPASGHFIHVQTGQPELVIRAVRSVVEAARSRKRLPPCRQLFAKLKARCVA